MWGAPHKISLTMEYSPIWETRSRKRDKALAKIIFFIYMISRCRRLPLNQFSLVGVGSVATGLFSVMQDCSMPPVSIIHGR